MLPGHPLCQALFPLVCEAPREADNTVAWWGLLCLCPFPSGTRGAAHSAAGGVMGPHCGAAGVGPVSVQCPLDGPEQVEGEAPRLRGY